MIEVDVTSPLIPNFARHALTADLTEDTSPVMTKYPLPPKPLAILKSTMLTLEAFTAVSAAIIAVKAEIVSIAPGSAELELLQRWLGELLHEYCQGYVYRLSKFHLRAQLCS